MRVGDVVAGPDCGSGALICFKPTSTLQTVFVLAVGILVLGCTVVKDIAASRRAAALSGADRSALRRFQMTYLPPYLLATFADWIQGPYQYKVYTEYGFNEAQIGRLYICGFGSSLLLGTYIAAAADTYGRRANCLLYCAVYSMSCLTKNSPNYHWLMVGRMLGGIATSILFATFESWCVTAYRADATLPLDGLDIVFTNTAFANALTAIVSALFGEFLVQMAGGWLIAPFNFVPCALGGCAVAISLTWRENYGATATEGWGSAAESNGTPKRRGRTPPPNDVIDLSTLAQPITGARMKAAVMESGVGSPWLDAFRNFSMGGVAMQACCTAAATIISDRRLTLLGTMGACVEATLYIFIFLWTPCLEHAALLVEVGPGPQDGRSGVPSHSLRHGVVFGAFMTWNMLGV
eukprot:COSAG01_NODE_8284_length_2844_cov_4.311840_4_plen_408_part_00